MTTKVTTEQRRGRLVERQLLGAPVASVAEVTAALVALHATDPVTVYLSAWARSRCAVSDVDAALYESRAVVRMLGMRRTVFVVPAALAPVVQAACTDDVAAQLRRKLVRDLVQHHVVDGDGDEWLQSLQDSVLRALAARGGAASGDQLSADEPLLRTGFMYHPWASHGRPVIITSQVLVLTAAEGRTVRGRRRGGWSSGKFEWCLPEAWLGDGKGRDPGLNAASARAELARRWLNAFGPALAEDLQWWAGWTGAQTKAALAALPVVEVELDGQTGVILANDLSFSADAPPGATLLPALDPTPMGWQAREWYLGPHAPALFDRTGNIGPTVWWEGRVVGGWAQRSSGEVVCRLLEDIGADGETAVAAEAWALQVWLDAARVTPRFRTPLERELSAGGG